MVLLSFLLSSDLTLLDLTLIQAPLHPLGLDLQCPSLSGLHSPILVRILPSRFSQNPPPPLPDQIIHPPHSSGNM